MNKPTKKPRKKRLPIDRNKPVKDSHPERNRQISYANFKKRFEKYAQFLCTIEEIASLVELSPAAMENYSQHIYGERLSIVYQRLINGGRMSLRRAQYISAVKSRNVTMQIWLGKQWLGQRENGSPFGGDRVTTEFEIREALYEEEDPPNA